MVIIGLLMLIASVGAAASIAANNTDSAPFDVFGWTVTTLSPGGLMLLGIALGVAGLAGLLLFMAGMRRARRKRLETKHVVQDNRSRVDELEEENTKLRQVVGKRGTASAAPAAGHESHGARHERDSYHPSDTDTDTDTDSPSATTARYDSLSNMPTSADGTGGQGAVYPDESAGARGSAQTPGFGDTTRDHGNRVFGPRDK